MSVSTRPWVARLVARTLQAGTLATAARMAQRAHARLPEYPRLAEETVIPTSAGPARATIYRPGSGHDRPAVHVNLHGGGYVLGLTEMDDPACRVIAAEAGVVVVNVDYVLAPQHPFPAPPRQVDEVVRWVAGHGDEHGWDGSRLTIGGQSAGGGLAAAAARLAFERQEPTIALQVLHYPPLDLSVPARSKHSVVERPTLRPWMGDVFDAAYAADPAIRTDRLVSPAGTADTADLTGIAPAVVIVAEHDILRAEGRRYAERLADAGALVELHEVPAVDHGYDLDDDDRARESHRRIAGHIRRAVERGQARG